MKLIIFLTVLFSSFFQIYALTGTEILEKANSTLNPEKCFSQVKMMINTSSGNKRTFKYDSYMIENNKKSIIRYTYPGRVKNQAVLLLNNGNDIWMFFPRTGRVRKLASHARRQKIQGSDFSYEDMGNGDSFLTDFSAQLDKEVVLNDEKFYRLILKRKENSDSSYKILIFYVNSKSFVPEKIEYFSNDVENPEKTLFLEDIKLIDNIYTPMKYIMKNNLDKTQTEMYIEKIDYKKDIEENMFSERGIRR